MWIFCSYLYFTYMNVVFLPTLLAFDCLSGTVFALITPFC